MGLQMGGLLIDTLANNFFQNTDSYNESPIADSGYMLRDFFSFLCQEQNKDYYLALGSNQHVKVPQRFQYRAKQAYESCLDAVDAEGKVSANSEWRGILGVTVPTAKSSKASRSLTPPTNHEEFIEEKFPVDISERLIMDCKVSESDKQSIGLRDLLEAHGRLVSNRKLCFYIRNCSVEDGFTMKWKVRNRGPEAERRDMLRGGIEDSSNAQNEKYETADFSGDHYVEGYILKNGVVVARDRIPVPIRVAS